MHKHALNKKCTFYLKIPWIHIPKFSGGLLFQTSMLFNSSELLFTSRYPLNFVVHIR
jgi:hypothetical protein